MINKNYPNWLFIIMLFIWQNSFATVGLKIFMKDEGISQTNMVKPRIYIQNTGTESVSNFFYYYYITSDSGKIPVLDIYYTPNCIATMENMGLGIFRVKYNFAGFTLQAGAISPDANGNVVGVHYSDWSDFNKLNDFSYIAAASFFEDTKIPVYSSNGTLLYGSDPSSGSTQPPVIPPVAVGDPPLLSQYVLYGSGQCILSDRDTIRGGMIGSQGYAEVGCDAIVYGTLSGAGNAFLRDRSKITGDVVLGGTLSQQNQVAITGTITQNSSLVYPAISTLSSIPTGSQNQIVQNNGYLLLVPGNYNDVHVYSNATITLNAGIYNVRTFVLEPDVHLVISASQNDIVSVNVTDLLSFGDRTTMQFNGTAWGNNVRFYSNQQSQFRTGTDSKIYGIITVPNAQIDIPSRTKVVGALYGQQIRIEPDVSICRPAVLTDFWHSEWVYTPAFDANTLSYTGIVNPSVQQIQVAVAAVTDATATINNQASPTTISLSSSQTTFGMDATNNSQCGGTHYTVNIKKQSDYMIYVDDNSGAPLSQCDGRSWYTAYKDLQKGIDSAAAKGKQVWVAEGLYKPTKRLDPADPRSASFFIQSGQEIVGGFKAIENTGLPAGSPYNTILSGDILGNDTAFAAWPPSSNTDIAKLADNVYHVMTINGALGVSSIKLQGFKIMGGVADKAGSMGIGAGVYDVRCAPTFEKCIFDHNYSLSNGAGLYAGFAPKILKNCLFKSNYSKIGSGGGLFSLTGQTNIDASIFDGNSAGNIASNGGAAYFYRVKLSMVNSIATRNNCGNDGGAFCCDSMTAAITNCTFYANYASKLGGGVTSRGATVNILNSIIWQNCGGSTACGGGNCFIDVSGSGFTINYSCLTATFPGVGNISSDPKFRNAANPLGDNGRYGDNDDGLQLSSISPCKDKGTGSNAPIVDLLGTQRPTGTSFEMGAYEYVNIEESNNLPFGRLIDGNFIGSNDLEIIKQIIHPVDILHYSKSKYHRILRIHVPKSDATNNASEMTIYLTPVFTDGSAAAPEVAVRLKKVGIDSNGLFLFQSKTPDYSWGKKILFTDEIYWHNRDNYWAYIIYMPTNAKLNYRIPHNQF